MFEQLKLAPSEFKFPACLRGLLIGPSQVVGDFSHKVYHFFISSLSLSLSLNQGKTTFLKDFLKNKDQMLVKAYTVIIYVSPNLDDNAANLMSEAKLLQEFRELAKPAHFDSLSSIPTLEKIMSYVQDESSKVLLLLDDFNFDLFASEAISNVYTRLSSHFNCDILATTHR